MLHASTYLTPMFAAVYALRWTSFCFILLLCPFVSHLSLWFSFQTEWPGFTPIQING
jgi:hypothetical protein